MNQHVKNAKILLQAIVILLAHDPNAEIMDLENAAIELLNLGGVKEAIESEPESEFLYTVGTRMDREAVAEHLIEIIDTKYAQP